MPELPQHRGSDVSGAIQTYLQDLGGLHIEGSSMSMGDQLPIILKEVNPGFSWTATGFRAMAV